MCVSWPQLSWDLCSQQHRPPGMWVRKRPMASVSRGPRVSTGDTQSGNSLTEPNRIEWQNWESNSKQCSTSFHVFISHLHDFFWVNVCLGLRPTIPSFWLTACLLIREDAHTLSLWVCVPTLLLIVINALFPCVCSHTWCRVFTNKLSTCFTVFASLKLPCFQTGTRVGATLLLASSPCWSSAQDSWFPSRVPRFHSWGIRSLFRTAHYFPSKITSAFLCQMFISAWFYRKITSLESPL